MPNAADPIKAAGTRIVSEKKRTASSLRGKAQGLGVKGLGDVVIHLRRIRLEEACILVQLPLDMQFMHRSSDADGRNRQSITGCTMCGWCNENQRVQRGRNISHTLAEHIIDYNHVSTYVCMYACVYVCMCMCVCTYAHMLHTSVCHHVPRHLRLHLNTCSP